MKRWRRYLFGSVGIVITDHKSLKALSNAAKEFDSPRMEKMALELSEHDLIIAHRAGARKDFGAADFTSRADIIGAEELKVMMGATFHDQTDIAIKLKGKLREQCLKPDMQQQRLKQQINFAELKESVRGGKVTRVREMVRMVKEGMRSPVQRQLEEDEHVARIEEFYDMVCTAAAEDSTAPVDISLRRIIEEQMQDKWSNAMIRHIQTQGVWTLDDEALSQQCIRNAPHFVVQAGVLMRVKFKFGSPGTHKQGQLPPTLQVYIPEGGGLRQQLVDWVHKQTGHAGVMRTYQALHDKFMWHGMFSQTMKTVGHCVLCQMHAPKPVAAPIQGHVTAHAPGEVVTMDLIHMPLANGMNYLLTVMDVFSKYAFTVPLTEATAVAVTAAVVHHVTPHGVGRPPYWVLDGGSEFKSVLAEVIQAWDAVPAVSSPNHPQSHGLIERYNRTISNKIAKVLDASGDALWTDVLPAATEIVNNQVQEPLTDRDAWLSLSEVWFARNPVLQELPKSKKPSVEPSIGMSQYVKRLKEHWKMMRHHVQESARLYQLRTRQRHRTKDNPLREFEVGDEVTYFKPDPMKRVAKITQKQQGPYKVVIVHPSGVEYTVQRVGSRNKKDRLNRLKIHVDRMRRLKRFKEDGGSACGAGVQHQAKPAAAKRGKSYDVEEICGERDGQGGQRQYLVKWQGYEECTWEPAENLSCPEEVQKWTKLQPVKQNSKYAAALRRGVATVMKMCTAAEVIKERKANFEEAVRVIMDLSDDEIDDVLEAVCTAAGISGEEVATILSSPPCETYSHADATNISRGFHYRDQDDPEKPPRAAKEGDTTQATTKREKAQNHDKMIQRLTQQMVKFREKYDGKIVMENPVGSLAKRPFMRTASWLLAVTRTTVMYCAYGYRYMKPTHLWTSLNNWKPCGITGDGKCGGRCGNGERHQREKRCTFKHWEQLAGSNDRLPKGGKTQLWSLPTMLTEEIMAAVAVKQPDKKYIIDLFAGGESWRPAVEQEGYVYVPVDIRKLMTKTKARNKQSMIAAEAA